MKNSTDNNSAPKNKNHSGSGLAIGIAIGTAIGVSTDNIGLWLALGITIGLLLDSASARKTEQKDKIPPNDKPS